MHFQFYIFLMFNIIYYLLQILILINNYISIVFFTSTFFKFIKNLLDNFLDYKVILDTLSQVYPYIPIKYQIPVLKDKLLFSYLQRIIKFMWMLHLELVILQKLY